MLESGQYYKNWTDGAVDYAGYYNYGLCGNDCKSNK
jgi:hypothetical protein